MRVVPVADVQRVAGQALRVEWVPSGGVIERIAGCAADRLAHESGVVPSSELVKLLCWPIDALLAMFEDRDHGPGSGRESLRLARARCRSDLRPSPVRLLLEWGVVDTTWAARDLAWLATGRDCWDDGVYGSSAVWAASTFEPTFEALAASERAAVGWALAVHRLTTGDRSNAGRMRVTRAVRSHRAARAAVAAVGQVAS